MLRIAIQVPPSPALIEALAEGLVQLNQAQFEVAELQGVEPPSLYDSGVLYRRENGREQWQSAAETLQLGRGDCEDLASWRAAELRSFEGNHARVRVIRTSRGSFHAIVEHEDGTREDPSAILVNLERKAPK